MSDEREREKILGDNENILITAGAGAGKTTILTKKIISDINNNKKHYKIAAITFTKKAAKEIKSRLSRNKLWQFIGTNDSFVEQEIIRPFIKDAFGQEYSNEFEVVYNLNKFDTFDEGLKLIKYTNRLCTYKNSENNFKFELALNILLKSRVARQYLQARYFKIYIDEYQDCDKDMHRLFMYIKDILKIKLFIVGDPKQSIYQWRGARPSFFNNLVTNKNNDFNKYELKENFRCCNDVQNYSSVVERENKDYYKELDEVNNVLGVKSDIDALKLLDLNKEITILLRIAKTKNQQIAKGIEEKLSKNGYNFVYVPRTPLDDLGTKNTSILIELAKYSKNHKYTIYDLINELPVELSISEIKDLDKSIKILKKTNIEEEVEYAVNEFFSILGISFSGMNEIDKFKESILNDEYNNSFNGKEYKHKIMTIHSAKGLEFEQVIMYADDFKLHWNRHKNEHYVATTRAKERLVIILNSKEYMNYLNYIVNKCDFDSINEIIKIV